MKCASAQASVPIARFPEPWRVYPVVLAVAVSTNHRIGGSAREFANRLRSDLPRYIRAG